MSHVALLAADRPLPLHRSGEVRRRVVRIPGHPDLHVSEEGFSVQEHTYYRSAVEQLGLSMKPFLYELDLRDTQHDLDCLHRYLDTHIHPGETIELWDLWVGNDTLPLRRFRGRAADFDLAALKQLQEHTGWQQTCFNIEC